VDHDAPLTPTRAVAERVRALRAERRWTAQKLADEMTAAGLDWNRGVVTKLETGRRESVSITELLALAFVLDVPPLTLLLPTEDVDYQVTPQVVRAASRVGAWVIAPGPPPTRDGESVPHPGEHAERQDRYRRQWPSYLAAPLTESGVEKKVEQAISRQLQELLPAVVAAEIARRNQDDDESNGQRES
jgi:transcriptional regulator with XRE-family HTH domain